jgi:large repetitive protein
MPYTLNSYSGGIKKCLFLFLLVVSAISTSFSQNAIVTENLLPGVPSTTWDIPNNFDGSYGDASINGFATDISVNKGGSISFKVSVTTGTDRTFGIKIYRLGFYGGNGARQIVDLGTGFDGTTPQPACSFDGVTGLTDCGNWTTTTTWNVPATAVSGYYLAKITRNSNGGSCHIAFIVRNDASTAAIMFKASDATWQAYNNYGGNSLYVGAGLPNSHASKVSYNRPFLTRNGLGGGGSAEDWLMNSEYPMIRFMEANGFDMTYTTDVDIARTSPNPILGHRAFLSVGHDEYWSKPERDNVEAARAAGIHLGFFSGNESYWKTRWENSVDGTNTPFRTLVCYKEGTMPSPQEDACGGKCDPTPEWTGLWRDGCSFPAGNACKPENALSGQISWSGMTSAITVPDTYKNLRFWRNTPVASLASGQTATLTAGTLGYEWDWYQFPTFYPAGRMRMSNTNFNGHTHNLSLYKSSFGGWVFGAGTVQWTWGLDANHDRGNAAPDISIQQSTINLFADMGIQPGSLQPGLLAATASTDVTPPASVITFPADGQSFPEDSVITITGTASDVGGVVAGVEVSVDGGTTWQEATGTTSWSFTWSPTAQGNVTIKSRAVDDSGNLESPGGSEGSANTITVIITAPRPPTNCPCTIYNSPPPPPTPPSVGNNGSPITLGVRFKAGFDGFVSAVRFYKHNPIIPDGFADTAHNTVQIWTTDGSLLGQATLAYAGPPTSAPNGWQEVTFSSPITITANTPYVASYLSSSGVYSYQPFGYTDSVVNGPLTAVMDNDPEGDGSNGIYFSDVPPPPPPQAKFPTFSFHSNNYFVDVVYTPSTAPDTAAPKVVSTSPTTGATAVDINSFITVTFSKIIDSFTVTSATFFVTDPASNPVSGTLSYSKKSRTATFVPSAPLDYTSTYTVTVKGGLTDPRIKDTLGHALAADYVWSFTTADPPPPLADEGGGGPVLVVSTALNRFSRYPVEMLRAQGYNGFLAKDLTELTPTILNDYDVVILGEANPGLSASDLTMFSNWVTAGGTLIVMRPDHTNAGLMNLLGITPTGATLADQYLLVNTTAGTPGAGIVGQTIQFHGVADLFNLNGATSLATFYSSATTATTNPAITTINVGTNGGKAIAFAYDLAKSVVYTRQGNPAWAGTSRDGQPGPIRSDNLFFPSWIDFNKVQIPQADEQQHLLMNIGLLSNLHKKPMPHLWFLPSGFKAAVVMTGDDHDFGTYPGSTGTALRFNRYMTQGPNTAQDVTDWKAVRATSYIYDNTPIPDDSVVYYQSNGFEIALHPTTACLNFTPASLYTDFTTQLASLETQMPSMTHPVSNRTHCLPWSDWSTQPKIESTLGIRYDVNYYYWPGSWVQNRPGMFTGSGMPMRFADVDGSIIDCYQSPTFITDESLQDIPFNINTLLDNAIGAPGYYGIFAVNMHTDSAIHTGSDAIVAAAQARQLPVVSAKQMLNWVDNRNNTIFGPMTWVNSKLSFTITTSAQNLQAMVPVNSADGSLLDVQQNGTSIPFSIQTIKGIPYGFFAASTNSFVAIYSSTALPVTLINFTVSKQGDDALLNWSTTMEENNSGFEIQRSTEVSPWTPVGFVPGAGNSQTRKDYKYLDMNLPAGTYYYRLRQVDLDGHSQLSKVVQVTFDGNYALELKQNRPNPFNSSTTIDIVIPRQGRVQLTLFDQMGRPLQQLMDEVKTPGTYSIPVNRNGLSSGIYYYKMEALGQSLVRKMTIF